MGRTLKRVPMDFEWPINQVWSGYLNPHEKLEIKCSCDIGYSTTAARFRDEWYGCTPFDPKAYGATPLSIDNPQLLAVARRNCERSPEYHGSGEYAVMREATRLYNYWKNQWSHNLIQADVDALVAANRLWDFTRVPLTEEQRETVRQKVASGGNSWLPEDNGYTPTAEEVNAWSLVGMGHDSLNQWVCVEARCKREGVELECRRCGGTGGLWPSEEAKRLYDEWEEAEPPTGDGYQLWETTSEGSPQSPVFATLDELCRWCAENATTFASFKATAEQWRKMLDDGHVHHTEGTMTFL